MIPHLSWGRWVVLCPSKDCLGAEKVKPGDEHTVCQCTDAGTCTHGPRCGEMMILSWPAFTDEIERLTRPRPVMNRNWFPGETIEDLTAENIEHGVEVP